MEIKTVVTGYLDENCYILIKNGTCLVVDPGDEFFKIKKAIGDKKVIGCLVTHFHQDHIEALEELVSYYDVEINKSKYGKFVIISRFTPSNSFSSTKSPHFSFLIRIMHIP